MLQLLRSLMVGLLIGGGSFALASEGSELVVGDVYHLNRYHTVGKNIRDANGKLKRLPGVRGKRGQKVKAGEGISQLRNLVYVGHKEIKGRKLPLFKMPTGDYVFGTSGDSFEKIKKPEWMMSAEERERETKRKEEEQLAKLAKDKSERKASFHKVCGPFLRIGELRSCLPKDSRVHGGLTKADRSGEVIAYCQKAEAAWDTQVLSKGKKHEEVQLKQLKAQIEGWTRNVRDKQAWINSLTIRARQAVNNDRTAFQSKTRSNKRCAALASVKRARISTAGWQQDTKVQGNIAVK